MSLLALKQAREFQWPLLKKEMVKYFKNKPSRCSTAELSALPWPRFSSTEKLRSEGYVPATIVAHGEPRRVVFKKEDIDRLAFEDEHAHLSALFKARLLRIHVGPWIEECVVDVVNVDPVHKHLFFLQFKRHVPGKVTEVEVPLTMVGLLGCPAYLNGAQVELATATVKCEVSGEEMPPPFIVDVSKLRFEEPYKSIYLRDLLPQLPTDGTVRFSRELDVDSTEIAWTYQPGRAVEQKLPADYLDPNFANKEGKKIMLTYKNYWPKQN